MSAVPVVTTTLDVRRLAGGGLRRQLGLTQTALGERIGARVDELSRLERALSPGGLLDRVVDGLLQTAGDAAPK